MRAEIALLTKLQMKLGGQKIDVLLDYPSRKVRPPIFNIAIEAAHTLVGMLAAIEKKLRQEHPVVQLYGSVL